MRQSFLSLSAALLLAAPLAAAAAKPLPAGVYQFDPAHSQLGFEVSHLVISTVNGKFDKFSGTITVKSRHAISVVASADAASVDTGNSMRDAHLRGTDPQKPKDDFFYAEKYPTLDFKSRRVVLKGDQLTVTGDLTIRGVTKLVTFTGDYRGFVKTPWGDERIAAELSTTINRQDFGLKFNALMNAGPIVGDDVKLIIDVEAVKQK